jgi:diaminopimelate epimerase
MQINFTKAEAAGNDFIIIEKDNLPENSDLSKLALHLCTRKKSIGADGLLVYESSETSDFKMRIFNPDGQEVNMCGNGSRCILLYADKKISKDSYLIETKAGQLEGQMENGNPKIKLTDPYNLKLNFDLEVDNKSLKANFINTGVAHVVCFVDNLEDYDVKNIGRKVRYHKDFQPKGTNANFVKVENENTISIRTYERGVEDETLSCGTGAAASTIITAQLNNMSSPITVKTQSGEILKIHFKKEDNNYKDVYLEGKCNIVYEGKVDI